MIFNFISNTYTFRSMRRPINFLVLRFAIANIETFSTKKLSFFATEIAMSTNNIISYVFALWVIHI